MSNRSTPSFSEGFTLVELLVGLTITLAVTLGALTLALSSRSLYDADHARVRLNQNLRASQDFITTDIRQAGERLGDDFPAIEIVNGAAGASDELVLRRNLLGTVLRSCRAVDGTTRRIYLAELDNPPPPGCVAVPDGNGDTWPDNHETWHEYRLENGVVVEGKESVPAYIYNPVTGNGEFFTYWADNKLKGAIRTPPGQLWQFSYPVDDQCRVYILEERRYVLNGALLQVIVNDNAPSPLSVVDGIVGFQAQAVLGDGTRQAAFDFTDVWSDLRAIEMSVDGRVAFNDGFLEHGWAAEIMPRNVLSH